VIVVSGSFDHFALRSVRLLDEASKLGPVELRLAREGELPLEERAYMWSASRFVSQVTPVDSFETGFEAPESLLSEIPAYCQEPYSPSQTCPKVIVTGAYDWLHSGHVRFFEEASTYGELTVVVGSDRNTVLLKGHAPMFGEAVRRYLVSSIRFVHQCRISSGEGWMDAAPEIDLLKPDIYIVNEDGDKPEKREYCEAHGLDYRVLARQPAPGLPRRASTDLRGF
jgi:cytidyltransferase-like protein